MCVLRHMCALTTLTAVNGGKKALQPRTHAQPWKPTAENQWATQPMGNTTNQRHCPSEALSVLQQLLRAARPREAARSSWNTLRDCPAHTCAIMQSC
jgi:hypothetical protein